MNAKVTPATPLPEQMRMKCAKCLAQWWHTPGSKIHPQDHARQDGRNCVSSLSYLRGEVIQTMTGLPPVKEAA